MMRVVAGCMTGTSMDGVSAAIVEIEGQGLGMTCRLRGFVEQPFRSLTETLRRAASGVNMSAMEFARLARALAKVHIAVLRELAGNTRLDLICVHGQTIYHQAPVSWQAISPAPIAHTLNVPVVFDLRQADLAAGGQGAPITPLADWVLFADAGERRTIVNLGGFCNVTELPASREASSIGEIRGGDICSCNHVLDTVARHYLDQPFDEDGRAAARGKARPEVIQELTQQFAARRQRGGALGSGDEGVSRIRKRFWPLPGPDMAATACAAVGRYIGEAVRGADKVLLAGGGTRNPALLAAIERHADAPVELTDSAGVPAEAREAVAMAVLGALCQDRVPITLPQVTGAKVAPVAGCWVLP